MLSVVFKVKLVGLHVGLGLSWVDLILLILNQVGMFKKSKGGWMQDFFSSFASSHVLTRPIENTQRSWRNDIVRFQRMSQERILHPPDISFRLDAKLILKLKQRLQRTRRPVQGVLVADSIDIPIGSFMEAVEQDLGSIQQADGVFCVGVTLTRGEGDPQIQKRVVADLRRCSERSSDIYGNSSRSGLSELTKATVRQLRTFLFLDEGRDGLSVGRLLYFPNTHIPFRKVKITPSSLAVNDTLNHIKNDLNFAKDATFGYISLIGGDRHKFVLIDRNDPQLQANPPPVLGVWAAGYLGSGLKRDQAIWSVLMEYITDPHLTKRLSVEGERTGLFFSFENPNSRDKSLVPYIFEFPSNARWAINTRIENFSKIPQEYCFTQQEVIMEEEREESEAESWSSKQGREQGEAMGMGMGAAAKALEDKDAEIRRLKVQVEFYKNQCEKLQEELNNIKVQQLAQKTIAANTLPPVYSYQEPTSDGPFFGRRAQQEDESPSKGKEFTIRDMKNISFAQENSFDEDPPTNSIMEKSIQFKFATPEFKEVREPKIFQKDIKAFNFNKDDKKKDQFDKEKERTKTPTPMEKERIPIEKIEKEKIVPESKQKNAEMKINETSREKTQENPLIPSALRSLQEKYDKYDNYKAYTKNVSGSPLIKQKQSTQTEEQDRKPSQSQKTTPKKEELPRRGTYQEEPREKRIKNQLYSQDKQPKKQNFPPSNLPPKRSPTQTKTTTDPKSPDSHNRSKSPLDHQKQNKPLDSDDDEDAELKTILAKRKKK